MSNKCRVCGTSIPTYRKFCSKSCYGESLSNKIERNCGICKKQFKTTSSKDKKYCSRECSGIARSNSQKIDCKNCGQSVIKQNNEINRAKNNFCSTACHNEHQREQNANVCQNCDTKYYYGGRKSKFCSIECSGEYKSVEKVEAHCPVCGDVSFVYQNYNDKHNNIFCSTDCRVNWLKENSLFSTDNPNYDNGKYRGFGSNWLEARKKEIESSNNCCKICGKSKQENGRNMSVHHIIPRKFYKKSTHFSLEDSNEQRNLISLCRSCHMKAEHGSIKKSVLYKNNNES